MATREDQLNLTEEILRLREQTIRALVMKTYQDFIRLSKPEEGGYSPETVQELIRLKDVFKGSLEYVDLNDEKKEMLVYTMETLCIYVKAAAEEAPAAKAQKAPAEEAPAERADNSDNADYGGSITLVTDGLLQRIKAEQRAARRDGAAEAK